MLYTLGILFEGVLSMISRGLRPVVLVLALVPVVLSAQITRERDRVLLKPWAAPLYWQPSQREAEAIALRPEATTAQLPTSPLVFVGMTPCRIVDTRAGQGFSGAFGPPSLNANASRTFPIQSSTACSIPSTALAYSMNVTVVPPGLLGFITAYPTGQNLPLAATLTDVVSGQIVSNFVVVAAGNSGSIDVYALNPTDLVLDINGYYASPNTIGTDNTAFGAGALVVNAGPQNTAIGASALSGNTSGGGNTAVGYTALLSNISGSGNVATGSNALLGNTTGSDNVASGSQALVANKTGNGNTAIGTAALSSNTTGNFNTALGNQALASNVSGTNNIAIGRVAGTNLSMGNSDNIHIGSQGSTSDNATIRIGTPVGFPGCNPACPPQTSFFAAGIRGVTTGNNDATAVVIDSNGQLGTVSSSRRFKEDIQNMGDASSGLLRLRPVTFRYQKPFADGSKPIQYGLIAEEVEEVYPDLVAHSADGRIESVKYQLLDSMLLNEVQRQHAQILSQNDQIKLLEQQLKEQQERIEKLAAIVGHPGVQ
jgi:trimeric autotransporter adhesin